MFTTERLILRAYKESDDKDLFNLANDFAVQETASMDYIVPSTSADMQRATEMRNNALLHVIITLKESGIFIGECMLQTGPRLTKGREAYLAIMIAKEFWNQGYGTETVQWITGYGFRSLRLHRISLNVVEGNMGGIRVYEKVGYIVEGRKRNANWRDGEWEDTISMGILDEEWKSLQGETHWHKV